MGYSSAVGWVPPAGWCWVAECSAPYGVHADVGDDRHHGRSGNDGMMGELEGRPLGDLD